MNFKIKIRKTDLNDFIAISGLSHQLGYKITSEQVQQQLQLILEDKNHFTFVAIENDQVVGYVHCFKSIRLTSLPFIEIAALIVTKPKRNKGIGQMLVEQCEQLASVPLRVRCNTKREAAHRFYTQLGYRLNKEQKVFEKIT